MNLAYNTTIAIIILEFGLVILIAIAACFFKLFYFFAKKRKNNLLIKIEYFFRKLVIKNENFNNSIFPKKWINLEILITTLINLDAELTSIHWGKIRYQFIYSIILPLARKNVSSKNWSLRLYVAEAFNLGFQHADEEHIVKLVNDETPLVYLRATSAAITFGSKATINAVINRMSRKRWITKSTFLQEFEQAPQKIQPLIVNRLKMSKNLNVRTACYTILIKFPGHTITWDILSDIASPDLNLKLAAIKYLAYIDRETAIPILIGLLKNKEWEVRLVALNRLGDLKAVEAIDAISDCLNDPEWWVKISAKKALTAFETLGEEVLQKLDPQLEGIPFDISKHITNTWW